MFLLPTFRRRGRNFLRRWRLSCTWCECLWELLSAEALSSFYGFRVRVERSAPSYGQPTNVGDLRDLLGNDESDLLDRCVASEGSRPQFEEVFDEVAGKHEGEEVGVLVCGLGSLQESVAPACRSRNFESLLKTPFYYHSASFDL